LKANVGSRVVVAPGWRETRQPRTAKHTKRGGATAARVHRRVRGQLEVIKKRDLN
jgi:hypothetical protein